MSEERQFVLVRKDGTREALDIDDLIAHAALNQLVANALEEEATSLELGAAYDQYWKEMAKVAIKAVWEQLQNPTFRPEFLNDEHV